VHKLSINILLLIAIFTCNSLWSQNLYKIVFKDNKTQIKFYDKWNFKKIAIPVHSPKIWGDNKSHNIAVIEIDNEKHIISSKPNEKYLEFTERTKAINFFTLTSINCSSEEIEEKLPLFQASFAKTKEIEDNLQLISQEQNDFITKNKCFSCHSMIPTAIAINTAYNQGFDINTNEIDKLLRNISSLQKDNGAFYFEKEPIYGIKTTTLSAVFISSLLSEIATNNFLRIGNKAKQYLNSIHKKNECIESDFNYEPFFNNETTMLLFEILFQKKMYLKDREINKDSNDRVNELYQISLKHEKIDYNKKLLLLCGIPYSFQIKPNELSTIKAELNTHINQAKSKISSISELLSLFVLKKLSPKQQISPIISINSKNFDKEFKIWNCLKDIIYNNPKYLDGQYDDK
jgi:hypothetical protein